MGEDNLAMKEEKEFKIAGMNYETWRAVCLKIGAQRMIKNGGDGVKKKSWMDIFKGLPKREKKGDPRNIERVAEFMRLCNENKNGGDGVEKYFKMCGFCNKKWKGLYGFLEDRDVFYRGFTEFEGIVVFFFDHRDCKTSMGVTAKQLGGYFQYMNNLYDKRPV